MTHAGDTHFGFTKLIVADEEAMAAYYGAVYGLNSLHRVEAGDPVVLFNGDGCDYPARLTQAGKRGAEAQVLERIPLDNESPLPITLAQEAGATDQNILDGIIEHMAHMQHACNVRWRNYNGIWLAFIRY